MAETSIQIQPAATNPAAPATQPLGMIAVPDGRGGSVLVQQVNLVNEDGDVYSPPTESTGMQIVYLLKAIHNLLAVANNGLQLPDSLEGK